MYTETGSAKLIHDQHLLPYKPRVLETENTAGTSWSCARRRKRHLSFSFAFSFMYYLKESEFYCLLAFRPNNFQIVNCVLVSTCSFCNKVLEKADVLCAPVVLREINSATSYLLTLGTSPCHRHPSLGYHCPWDSC